MSAEEFSKRITDMVMNSATSSGGDLPDPSTLLAELRTIMEEIRESGVMDADDFEKQMTHLIELSALNAASNDAMANKDFDELAKISEKMAALSGIDLAAEQDRPEIFDAIEDGDLTAVRRALEDYDVNQTHGQFDQTALYAAMSQMFGVSLEIVETLLDAGADPKKGLTDSNVLHGLGFGRLDGVSAEALAKTIKRCVALGADIEQRTNNLQWTPLHTALTEWNEVAAEALLLAGADPNARAGSDNRACTAGQSCLEMSIMRPALLELLLAHGADPRNADDLGRDAFGEVARLMSEIEDDDFQADLRRCQAALKRHEAPN